MKCPKRHVRLEVNFMAILGESLGQDREREVLQGSLGDYIAPGLYRWMLEDPDDGSPADDTITSIDGLREHERQDKKAWRERHRRAVQEGRRSLEQSPPNWNDLTRQHQRCILCPIRIRRREMWRHPLRTFYSICRSRRANRAFRRRMSTDLEALEKSEGGPFRG